MYTTCGKECHEAPVKDDEEDEPEPGERRLGQAHSRLLVVEPGRVATLLQVSMGYELCTYSEI